MRHLSLFSGVGGIDLGFERAGMTTVGHVEFDKHARQVLEARFPGVPTWNDVREVHGASSCVHGNPSEQRGSVAVGGDADDTGDTTDGRKPLPVRSAIHQGGSCDRCLPDGIDVLSGGFPCQDISVAGKRAGLDGERSGLWYEFKRLIGDISPTWVLVENVPGLLSSNAGRDLGTIVGSLGEFGYRWAFRVFDSQYFGVAQRRRRVFVVGCRGAGSPSEVLFEPESVSGDSPPRREEGQTDSLPAVVGTIDRGEWRGPNRNQIGTMIPFAWRVRQDADPVIRDTMPALQAAGQHEGMNQFYGRWQNGVRRLMPVECERLQGFPDGWSSDIVSDSQAYRQMGNAVTVPVAEWIGKRIMAAHL